MLIHMWKMSSLISWTCCCSTIRRPAFRQQRLSSTHGFRTAVDMHLHYLIAFTPRSVSQAVFVGFLLLCLIMIYRRLRFCFKRSHWMWQSYVQPSVPGSPFEDRLKKVQGFRLSERFASPMMSHSNSTSSSDSSPTIPRAGGSRPSQDAVLGGKSGPGVPAEFRDQLANDRVRSNGNPLPTALNCLRLISARQCLDAVECRSFAWSQC